MQKISDRKGHEKTRKEWGNIKDQGQLRRNQSQLQGRSWIRKKDISEKLAN